MSTTIVATYYLLSLFGVVCVGIAVWELYNARKKS